MRKVYAIWFFKKIAPFILADILVFGAFLYVVGEYTFVRVILDNLTRFSLSSPSALLPYFFDAAFNAQFVVLISLIGALAAIILASKNIFAFLVQFRVFKEETNLKRGVFY